MREWNYSDHEAPIAFDFTGDFDAQAQRLKSKQGGSFKLNGHNYYVLKALFKGNVIDDYENPPMMDNGLTVRNVRSRIADLRLEWNICIGDRFKEGKVYKEYMIQGRAE